MIVHIKNESIGDSQLRVNDWYSDASDVVRFIFSQCSDALSRSLDSEFVHLNITLQKEPVNGRIDFDFVPIG